MAYILNKNGTNGNKIHKKGCIFGPDKANTIELKNCKSLAEAKIMANVYSKNVSVCKHCLEDIPFEGNFTEINYTSISIKK